MSATHQRQGELWVLMLLRRLGFGRNPLRRKEDRVESALLLSALVAGLLVIPAAAALGTTVRDRAEQTAAQQRAELHPVQARTLEDTADVVPASLGRSVTRVRVMWFDRSGSRQEGWSAVVIGTRAGTDLAGPDGSDGSRSPGVRRKRCSWCRGRSHCADVRLALAVRFVPVGASPAGSPPYTGLGARMGAGRATLDTAAVLNHADH
jgi:hypothetical protein